MGRFVLVASLLLATVAFAEPEQNVTTAVGRRNVLAGLYQRDPSISWLATFEARRSLYDGVVRMGTNADLLRRLGANGQQTVTEGAGRLELNYVPGYRRDFVDPLINQFLQNLQDLPLTEFRSPELDLAALRTADPLNFRRNAMALARLSPILYFRSDNEPVAKEVARGWIEELRSEAAWHRMRVQFIDYFEDNLASRLHRIADQPSFQAAASVVTMFRREEGLVEALEGMTVQGRAEGARNVRLTRVTAAEAQLLENLPSLTGRGDHADLRLAFVKGARVYLVSHGRNTANTGYVIAYPLEVKGKGGKKETIPYLHELHIGPQPADLGNALLRDVMALLQHDFQTTQGAIDPPLARRFGFGTVPAATAHTVVSGTMPAGWAEACAATAQPTEVARTTRDVYLANFTPTLATYIGDRPFTTVATNELPAKDAAVLYGVVSNAVPGRNGGFRHADAFGNDRATPHSAAFGISGDGNILAARDAYAVTADLPDDLEYNRLTRPDFLNTLRKRTAKIPGAQLFPMLLDLRRRMAGQSASKRRDLDGALLQVFLASESPWTSEVYDAVQNMGHLIAPQGRAGFPIGEAVLTELVRRLWNEHESAAAAYLSESLLGDAANRRAAVRELMLQWLRRSGDETMPSRFAEAIYAHASVPDMLFLLAREPGAVAKWPDFRLMPRALRDALEASLPSAERSLPPAAVAALRERFRLSPPLRSIGYGRCVDLLMDL